jgi:hypothetical protein
VSESASGKQLLDPAGLARRPSMHLVQGTAFSVHAIKKNRCNFETLGKEKLELPQRPWH